MGKFPIKKEGDDLGASHVNALSAGVEKAELYQKKGFFVNGSGIPSIDVQTVVIAEVGCDGNPDLYRVVVRYWDPVSSSWATSSREGNKGYRLDATDTDLSFDVDDKIQAFYNAQRGAYIPLLGGGGSAGSHHIEFVIEEVVTAEDPMNDEGVFYCWASWTTYTGGCSEPPGIDPYTGLLKLYDTCVLELYYTSDGLLGKEGYASYLYGNDPYLGCVGKWKALSLCGEPECA